MCARSFVEAQTIYQNAANISEKTLGPDHPETAKHLGNVGAALLGQKKIDESRKVLQRVIGIWEKQTEKHPVYWSGSLTTLAQCELEAGDQKKALEHFESAYTIQKQAFGASDPRLLQFKGKYMAFLKQIGDTNRIKELEEEQTSE